MPFYFFSVFFLFFLFRKILFYFQLCVSVCVHVHMYVGDHGGQKSVSESLELELKRVVNHLTWVLETEL